MRLNRRVPNGTHSGVRGRGLLSPSYSIFSQMSGQDFFYLLCHGEAQGFVRLGGEVDTVNR